ncbi:hypothetical protein [Halosimplex marinum]|uniref:hypothetical protein n=1 Tax=Halosimplex marinum TaxID=3396620 RepID=UPI003F55758B
MSPVRADALVDLAYGGLIALSIVLIATVNTSVGVAFGVGVFAAYVVHVVWKMVRFDPDWMTRTVEEAVEEQIESTMEETVEATMEDTVEARVEATVEDTVEQTVEESMEETVEAVERTMSDQLDEVQTRVESLDERIDGESRTGEASDGSDGSKPDDGRA